MRIIWCEKFVIFLLILEAVAFFLLSIGNAHIGTADWFASLPFLWRPIVATVGPIWAILRAVDWLAGGPDRRRGQFIVRPLSPWE